MTRRLCGLRRSAFTPGRPVQFGFPMRAAAGVVCLSRAAGRGVIAWPDKRKGRAFPPGPYVGLRGCAGQKVLVQPTVASHWYISISAVPPPNPAGMEPDTLLLGEYMAPKLIKLFALTFQPRPAV